MRSQPSWSQADENRLIREQVGLLGRMVLLVCLVLLRQAAAQESPRSSNAMTAVRTIQVESIGEGTSAEAMRQKLVDRLNKDGRFKVVESRSAADVVLRGTSSIWATGTVVFAPHSKAASQTVYQGYLSVELVDKADQILWSYLLTPSRFRTANITDDLADHMASHLLDALKSGAAGAHSTMGRPPRTQVALHAAGATFPAPIYLKWFESSGMPVTYDAIGSEAGIAQLAEGKVDFAASDMPLTEANSPAGLHVIHFPTVLGGVVPIYNLPALGHALRFTPEMLAGIYSGTIRKWNDPRILEMNHGTHLPDTDIAVVHRSDGSGTTFVWTSFLSLVNAEWKDSVGAGTHVAWPTGAGATGNEGVAELVQKTPNSIGYVELIYAIQHELNYGAVRNPAGEFIKADLASITAAASSATASPGQDLRFSILNSANKDAYPISTFTWLLVPAKGMSAEKRAAIAEFLKWALTTGQKQCEALGYAPLSHEIVSSELQAVSAWKSNE